MAKPLLYSTGEEIRNGDRVLLRGETADIDFVLDGEDNPADWPAKDYGRGVMISEPKTFGYLLLSDRYAGYLRRLASFGFLAVKYRICATNSRRSSSKMAPGTLPIALRCLAPTAKELHARNASRTLARQSR
jgi:hypothetical protein